MTGPATPDPRPIPLQDVPPDSPALTYNYGFGVIVLPEPVKGLKRSEPLTLRWQGWRIDVHQLDEVGLQRLYWLCALKLERLRPSRPGFTSPLDFLYRNELRRFAQDYPLDASTWDHPLGSPAPSTRNAWENYIGTVVGRVLEATRTSL